MKRNNSLKLLGVLLSFSLITPLKAQEHNERVEAEVALDVIEIFNKLPSTTTIDKWVSDQWAFYATSCARAANIEIPKNLENYGIKMAGSWRLPEDIAAACNGLRKGLDIQCSSMTATQPPFVSPPMGSQRSYSYLEKNFRGKMQTTVGGYCNLGEGGRDSQQFFAVPATVEWKLEPRHQQFNSFSGTKILNAGTLSIKVEGLPEQFVTVVVLD